MHCFFASMQQLLNHMAMLQTGQAQLRNKYIFPIIRLWVNGFTRFAPGWCTEVGKSSGGVHILLALVSFLQKGLLSGLCIYSCVDM